jgi:flagellar protein FlbD
MIQLTRLNNHALIVNCDLIKFVESAPDTVLTLVSGEKIVVREAPQEVLERIMRFRRLVAEACPPEIVERGPENGSADRGPDRG